MVKGRSPQQGKDIGVVRTTAAGSVWATKREAKIAAKKYGGGIRRASDGWWARASRTKRRRNT